MANRTQLLALSPLDGRYQQRISSIQQLFSEFGLIKHRVVVEVKFLIFLLEKTKIQSLTESHKKSLTEIIASFDEVQALRVKQLEESCNHDVKAVEYYLQEQFHQRKISELIPFIHFGLTSEDINSCAYGLSLKEANSTVIIPAVAALLSSIISVSEKASNSTMLARTHGQPAVPTTLGKEMLVWSVRLEKQLIQLNTLQIEAKLSGAVGNWNALQFVFPETDWLEFSDQFISTLGLKPNNVSTQSLPSESYSEFFQALIRIQAILIDCSRDCWQYISDGYLVQQVVQTDVGSSTMPHKVNPIDFENCEGNAGLSIALLQHFVEKLPISRLQRDLSDSTVKRSIGTALGHALLAINSLRRGLEKVEPDNQKMLSVVKNHPEIVSEALQTALRLSGVPDAYDQVKQKTRGRKGSYAELASIADSISDGTLRERYKTLEPQVYTGLAAKIVKQEVSRIKKILIELQLPAIGKE